MVKIVVDCFGGDKSPSANVEGCALALKEYTDLSLVLTGDENVLREELKNAGLAESDRVTVVNAPEIISCNDKPTDAIRLKKDSSMMTAVRLLREDDSISGMVSIGSTGALVAASVLRVGRLKGVLRPAFCPILPTMNGGIVGVCDSGANVDCKPDYLVQFAIMGSKYMESVYGVKSPRVALLNIGTEEEKGDELHKQVYAMLKETPEINFVGNMESRDVLSGNYDLIVCDGFSGNVMIKSVEGTAIQLLKKIKSDIYTRFKYKFGALFLKEMFVEEKELLNYQNYGGSVMLGCSKTVVKGHGSSNSTAVCACIGQAYKMEKSKFGGQIEEYFERHAEHSK